MYIWHQVGSKVKKNDVRDGLETKNIRQFADIKLEHTY